MMQQEFYRRHLPHWQPTGATFFVTFRLKGSLPNEVLVALKEQRERDRRDLLKLPDNQRLRQDEMDNRRSFGRWDAFLDAAEFGPQWLSQLEIAEIVKRSLLSRDNQEYDLLAFCIMSNHVHVVFGPPQEEQSSHRPLQAILKALKGSTAREANLVLGRTGPFWQDESYDHVVRDQEELQRIIHYVLGNPVKAGLVIEWQDWPWSYCKP